MYEFVINAFVPDTLEGSAVATVAYIVADKNHGAVMIHRMPENDAGASLQIQRLMRNIQDADTKQDPIASQIEIWVGNIATLPIVDDELTAFNWNTGRKTLRCPTLFDLDTDNMHSVSYFLADVYAASEYGIQNEVSILYDLIEPDEFECLMAHLLSQTPWKKFEIKNDYVLNLFVEREKKKRAMMNG